MNGEKKGEVDCPCKNCVMKSKKCASGSKGLIESFTNVQYMKLVKILKEQNCC